jgi:glucokinase
LEGTVDGRERERARLALGIDIGGTKLAAAVVLGDGTIEGRGRVEVLKEEDRESFFAAVIDCARAALADAGATYSDLLGVGCGCGGPMIWPEGVVSPINISAWRDFPLRRRLAGEFPGLPVFVHNDAVALVVGEHWKGRGSGVRNLLALTISTGIGGGLILDNRLHHGSSGNAGHVGHIVVEPNGPPCACGGRGCLEAIASGPSAVRRALIDGWSPPPGSETDGRALAQSAADGNRIAIRCLERAGSAIGVALASCANLLDLDAAILAGGFSLAGPLFWEALNAGFAAHSHIPFAGNLEILQSRKPREVGVLGAAAFALASDRYGWPFGERDPQL